MPPSELDLDDDMYAKPRTPESLFLKVWWVNKCPKQNSLRSSR